MKSKKKVFVTVLCAVLLVVASVLGTMAYLTSQDTVNNTFTVGNVAITLDEAKVNLDGVPVNNDGEAVGLASAPRVKANTYKLIPGHSYLKDPTIHVDSNSEDCWLFVKVENGISGIEASANTIAAQMDTKGWSQVTGVNNVYAYRSIANAGDNIAVFDAFTIAGDAETAGYADANITVTGYAVQADGFGTAQAAWDAAFGSSITDTDDTTDSE